MKPVTYLILGVCLSLLSFFGYSLFTEPSSAQRNARLQWEYAAITNVYSFNPQQYRVNKIYGMAEICYLQNTGCRRSEIKHELDYGIFLQKRSVQENLKSRTDATLKATEIAFQKAAAQLGSEGWEIVTDPNLNFEYVNFDDYNKFDDKSVILRRENTKAVYFKRLKTQ